MDDRQNLPIGVFDSGVGGLTVLNEICRVLPHEHLLYLGDTARVPYGTKSPVSIKRYAEQAAKSLLSRQVKALIVACNTASAVSVDHLRQLYPDILIIGVIEPGAAASCVATQSGSVGVIATESTVNNYAYQNAILRLRPDASVKAVACSLFVALAEEGWHQGDLVEQIVDRCLQPFKLSGMEAIDTLVLGCTHFPVLKGAIAASMGSSVTLVDSAETTARVLDKLLGQSDLHRQASERPATIRFMVTDGPERFARVAGHFFSQPIDSGCIELIDIQHF